jgi:hypothetical protein
MLHPGSPLETPAGCPVAMEEKACPSCGNSYEATKANFPRLGNHCRACVRTRRTKQAEREQLRRKKALAKIEAAGIDLYAETATAGGSNIPHSAEVLERLFQYFGGVAGFSAIMVKQYYDSPAGGSARSRLLETIVRLVTKNVEAGGAKRPLSLWTEDELEAELEQRFAQALNTYKGVTVDVKALPKAEEASAADRRAGDSDAEADPDAAPEGRNQGSPSGDSGEKAGGVEALPPDADAAEGS